MSRWARWASGKPLRRRLPALFLAFVLLGLVIALVASDRENIFTIDVSTEVAALKITDPVLSQWTLSRARLIGNPFEKIADGRSVKDGGVLLIETATQVRLQRHGVGEIRIQLTSDSDKSVGTVETIDGSRIDLGTWALLLVETAGRPMLLPFRGTLTLGDDVAAGVDSILLGGKISVVEEQLLGETHYIAGAETLNPGDRVRLWQEGTGSEAAEQAKVSGFVRAETRQGFSEPRNALTVVAHGQADYVKIDRLGSAGYQIRAPHWARFLYDPLLAASISIIALVALLFELLSKSGSLFGGQAGNSKGKQADNACGSHPQQGTDVQQKSEVERNNSAANMEKDKAK